MDCIVVSAYYWPALQDDAVKHHPAVLALLQAFTDTYAAVRKPRTIRSWPTE